MNSLYRNTFQIFINPKVFFSKTIIEESYGNSILKLLVYYLLFEIIYLSLIIKSGEYSISDVVNSRYILWSIVHYVNTFLFLFVCQYAIALMFNGVKLFKVHFTITSNLLLLYPLCVFSFFPALTSFLIWQLVSFILIILIIILFYYLMVYSLKISARVGKLFIIIMSIALSLLTVLWVLFWKYLGHLP